MLKEWIDTPQADWNRRMSREHDEKEQAMSGWTEADIDARNRSALHDLMKVERAPRVKGVAVAADRTYNGRVYHSKAEAEWAVRLDLAVKAGGYKEWWPQVRYPIVIKGRKVCDVVVDFVVETIGGKVFVLEVKGHETDLYKLKVKLLRACYPDLNYVVEKV